MSETIQLKIVSASSGMDSTNVHYVIASGEHFMEKSAPNLKHVAAYEEIRVETVRDGFPDEVLNVEDVACNLEIVEENSIKSELYVDDHVQVYSVECANSKGDSDGESSKDWEINIGLGNQVSENESSPAYLSSDPDEAEYKSNKKRGRKHKRAGQLSRTVLHKIQNKTLGRGRKLSRTKESCQKCFSDLCDGKCQKSKESLESNYFSEDISYSSKKALKSENYQYSSPRDKIHELMLRLNNKLYRCSVCHYESSYRNDCVRHIMIHTGEKPFGCHMCAYKSNRKDNLKKHLHSKHKLSYETSIGIMPQEEHSAKKTILGCPYCSYGSNSSGNLKNHMKKAHKNLDVLGEPIIVDDKEEFEYYQSEIVIPEKELCSSCNSEVCDESCTKDFKDFSCNLCDFECDDDEEIQKHYANHKIEIALANPIIKYHKLGEAFVCPECSASFLYRKIFVTHLKTHQISQMYGDQKSGEKKNYICKICSMNFENLLAYNHHLSSHSEPDNFKCSSCPLTFLSVSELEQHNLTHSLVQFKCPDCEFEASDKPSLKDHIYKFHCHLKYLQCSSCDFKTDKKHKLKRHEMIHTGIKPYACEKCDYRSNRKGNLKIHTLVHLKEYRRGGKDKPLLLYSGKREKRKERSPSPLEIKVDEEKALNSNEKCIYCEYQTTNSSLLQSHVKSHCGVAFTCPRCSFKCLSYNTMKNHFDSCRHHDKIKCTQCSHVSLSRTDHIRHLQEHRKSRHHVCSYCGLQTFDKKSFDEHMKVHLEDDNFPYQSDL